MSDFVYVENYLDEIKDNLPKFVFYRRGFHSPSIDFWDMETSKPGRKVTDCYCTACHTRYEDNVNDPKCYKHKRDGICANCGALVEYRQMDRGRSTYYRRMNFAVFEGEGDFVRIACIVAEATFLDGELEPDVNWYTVTRYELQPGQAQQFWRHYSTEDKKYIWSKKKSRPIEPNFASGFFTRDSNYHLINHDVVQHSFLRYLFKDEEQLPSLYIQWLCRYAEHPQLEYFLHGGLTILARKYVEQNLYYNAGGSPFRSIRFNWRSNDLKKVLHLDKPELNYFIDTAGEYYPAYINWRKHFFKGKTPAETIKYFAEFKNSYKYIEEIEKKTGIDRKKIMDYTLKRMNNQGSTFFLICYRDYINECIELKYDLKSDSISMPRDLFAMHERTSHIVAAIRDKQENDKLEISNQKRQGLEVIDMELGLELRLPRSVKEIADEGAALSHCVGGYANRHAEGKLTIAFLRTLGHPERPYYTMEISNDLHIVQCRGYRNNNANNPKPEEIIEFERRYTEYLAVLKAERKKAKQKAKRKKMQKAKAAA